MKNKLIISNVEDFVSLKGCELGCSLWFTISQNIINDFADATYDHQWIHVDPVKADLMSHYHKTIAHGYLTLSLLPHLLDDIIEVKNLRNVVNYGIKDIIYKSPVVVDSRIRLRLFLKSAKDLGNICQATLTCKVEIEGQEEPALEGNIIYLYYFE